MQNNSSSIDNVLSKGEGLQESLRTRQIVMVGVGGTIGTGLFLGSGYVISEAGPGGTLLSYLLAGLVMWLMMMCLGELSSAMPVSGGVQAYATEFINPAMGFSVGWVNWVSCALTITSQIVASAIIMKNILPSVDTAVWLVGFTLLLFGVNVLNVKQYGEASFWFGSLKLLLIIVFILLGTGLITGVIGNAPLGFSNYTSDGGILPRGFSVIMATMLTTIYAYGGSDLFASGAGEMKNKKDVPKAVHATSLILIGCYMVSLCILLAVLPWSQANLMGSPFAYVFNYAGIPSAELIINIIILTSALSSGNYFVYACTRYLWSLSKYGQAPKVLSKVNKRKVPLNALSITMVFAALAIVASFVAEDTVYLFLMYLIGGGNVFIYSTVCVCQIRFRRKYIASGGDLEKLNYRTPLYPLVPILGILAYILILIGTVVEGSERVAIFVSLPIYLITYLGFYIYTKKKNVKAANIKLD